MALPDLVQRHFVVELNGARLDDPLQQCSLVTLLWWKLVSGYHGSDSRARSVYTEQEESIQIVIGLFLIFDVDKSLIDSCSKLPLPDTVLHRTHPHQKGTTKILYTCKGHKK